MTSRLHFAFLNIGHFLDHLFMLVFATAAALTLSREWGMSYAELIPYATPGFLAFGAFALPAGWCADKWSREGMMTVFFIGIGVASVLTALARTPFEIGVGLFLIGTFAAIYHPVGIALVLQGRRNVGLAVAVNGVWGNMGVAVAAVLTALLIEASSWRAAFVAPGVVSIILGLAYGALIWRRTAKHAKGAVQGKREPVVAREVLVRVLLVVMITTAIGGLSFQSTTFALPRILAERTGELAVSVVLIGWLTFIAFAVGAAGQLCVGFMVDRTSPRIALIAVAGAQIGFFALMTGLHGWPAIIVAAGFMFAAFGQIPINDVLIGRVATADVRSRVLAVRYLITITVMAATLPIIAYIHGRWGFDVLFIILAASSTVILALALALPRRVGHTCAQPST